MGRKTTVWTFYATNKQRLTRENMDVAKKGKPYERNCISPDSSTKQRYEKQPYPSKNK